LNSLQALGCFLVQSDRILLEKLFQSLEVSVALVLNGRRASGRVEIESGESLNVNTDDFIGRAIEFGDDYVIDIVIFFGQLFPDGCKLFAVSTPWGVIFNKDVGFGVFGNLIVILSSEDSHSFSRVWDWFFRFQEGRGSFVKDGLNKLTPILIGRRLELDVGLHAEESDLGSVWRGLGLDGEVVDQPGRCSIADIDVREQHAPLVGLGDLPHPLDGGLVLVARRQEQEEVVLDGRGEQLGGVGEVVDEGLGVLCDELDEGQHRVIAFVDVDLLVELLQEDDAIAICVAEFFAQ